MNEPTGYKVIDNRRYRDKEFGEIAEALTPAALPERESATEWPVEPKMPMIDQARERFERELYARSTATAEIQTERAEGPEAVGHTLNRKQRHANETASRRATKKAQKKTWTFKEKQRSDEEDKSPLDPITFLGVISKNMNEAVCANERARERIPSAERMNADELQMSMELAFVLSRIDAYGPENPEDRLRIIAIAQDLKKKLKFKQQDGELVKPKPQQLIATPPPLIVMG